MKVSVICPTFRRPDFLRQAIDSFLSQDYEKKEGQEEGVQVMPVKIRKVGNRYRVSTPSGTKAKGTTKAKAQKQRRLLNAIDHGWKPSKPRKRT